MNEIPDDILKAATKACHDVRTAATTHGIPSQACSAAMVAIGQERERCLSIVKAIETRNPSEAHLIETIVRRLRGDE